MHAALLVATLALTHAPKATECLIAREGGADVSFSQFVAPAAARHRDYATLNVVALASKEPVVTIVEFGPGKVVVGNEAALALAAAKVGDVAASQGSGRIVVPIDGLKDVELKIHIVTFPSVRVGKAKKTIDALLKLAGAVPGVSTATEAVSTVVDGLLAGFDNTEHVSVARRLQLTAAGQGDLPIPGNGAPLIITDGTIDEYDVATLKLVRGRLNREAHGAVVTIDTSDWDDEALSNGCVDLLESSALENPRGSCADEPNLTRAHRRLLAHLGRAVTSLSDRPGLAEASAALRLFDGLAQEAAWTRDTRPATTLARLRGEVLTRFPLAELVARDGGDLDALRDWLLRPSSSDPCADRREGATLVNAIDAAIAPVPAIDQLLRVARERTFERARACAGGRKLDPGLLSFITAAQEPNPTVLARVTAKDWYAQLQGLQDLPELTPRLLNATAVLAQKSRDRDGVSQVRALAQQLLKHRLEPYQRVANRPAVLVLQMLAEKIDALPASDGLDQLNEAIARTDEELATRLSELNRVLEDDRARDTLPIAPPN